MQRGALAVAVACGHAGPPALRWWIALLVPPMAACWCGACVDACPVDAIAIERDAAGDAEELASYHDMWVIASRTGGDGVDPVTFELLGCARELARARSCRVVAVLAWGRR